MQLRDYQLQERWEIYQAWDSGIQNVCAQAPTGSGKTVLKASILDDFNDYAIAVAHRKELVSQIALTLAKFGIRHRIIAPSAVRKACAKIQVERAGRSMVYPNAKVAVAGAHMLARPSHELDQFAKKCGLWSLDEGHHLLADNLWGRGLERFSHAWGVGFTATPTRTDGKGLGRHADGLYDHLVLGPEPAELMRRGQLCDYRIVGAGAHLEGLKRGASGEYTGTSVAAVMDKSHIIGRIVPTWLKFASNKRTVIFAHNIKAAGEILDEFRAIGVNAALITAKTDDRVRFAQMAQFEAGTIQVLINVDLFGEGVDVPAIECAIFGRPTASVGLYMQQGGRVLRPFDGKDYGLIIDHVGNSALHGLLDAPRVWTLDARDRRRGVADDVEPTRTCANPECQAVYERYLGDCPFCGWLWVPAERSGPAVVEGDLELLDPTVLAQLRKAADRIHETPEQAARRVLSKFGSPLAQDAAAKRQGEWLSVQRQLRATVEQWSGYLKHRGLDDRQIQRKFFIKFGVDILTAYGNRKKSELHQLHERVDNDIRRMATEVAAGRRRAVPNGN